MLPQAIRFIIPSLISQLVVVVKDTTVAYVVSYPDLMQNARVLITNYDALVSVYLVIAVIYILINVAINKAAVYVSHKTGATIIRQPFTISSHKEPSTMAQSTSSTGNQPLIELRHVDKHYGDLHVLNGINLSVDRGEVVVEIGPSGSGKSTMCRTINRLETIDSGEELHRGRAPTAGRQGPCPHACRAGHGVSAVQPVRTYDRPAERHAGTGDGAGRLQGRSP